MRRLMHGRFVAFAVCCVVASTAAHAEPGDEPRRPATVRPAANLAVPITLTVAAAAVLGGAAGMALWGDAVYDDAKAETVDQERRDSLERAANTRRHAAQGLLGVGVATAGVAVWLFLRPPRAADPTAATGAQLSISPAGIAYQRAF